MYNKYSFITDEHLSVGLGRDKLMIDNILSPEI